MDLQGIQKKWQERWDRDCVFESYPSSAQKFFMTIPYPYISGSLHIGHARVVTEADVYTRYQRMTGKNTLYPIAFHISGTPVLGISLAIKNNDEKKIDLYKGYVRCYVSDEKKVADIVNSFVDPEKIVEFFIPRMKDEFKTLGLSVDWRRSFTSGDIEHQALVEWQFRKFKAHDYLIQGKYPILFSKTLNNAVGEDDIQEGDTDPVSIQEFTLIKFRYKDGFILAATLRPETMYGQTNMWANPDATYSSVKVNGEKWIISKECAEKLKFQDKSVEIVGSVSGSELMGKMCFAPFVEKEIMILPSAHCNPDIGTGIVTSVPSDAPFDYIALKELQDSKTLCEKYHLDYERVKSIQLIPIINSKGYGDFPAVEICKKLGISRLSQHDKLAEATQEIYKVGFHTGVMNDNCGPYKGMPVTKAKDEMKKSLLKDKKADILYESSRIAKSRDGGDVIVAVLDGQWFLDYNAKGWKHLAKECLGDLEIWPDKYRKQFEDVFDWLDKRPCARKRGLGTKLPFDKDWVIESLSDSTLYMSLYPIVHLIRMNKMTQGQLNDSFFEYVYNSVGDVKVVAKGCGISDKALKEMHDEWTYWYPFDQRHTFQAHLSNHLSFMIFAHVAALKDQFWPKRISFHGMIISEGEKMSKSKGNVITLMDINNRFGADPFRAFMCNSTSVDSTFNWQTDQVEVMRKHIASLFDSLSEIQSNKSYDDSFKRYRPFVSKTERAIGKAGAALEKMDLRGYSNIVLYEMLNNYRRVLRHAKESDAKSLNAYFGNRLVSMLCPLVPHIAEELWSMDKKNVGFVSNASWPKSDRSLIDNEAEYQEELVEVLKADISTVIKLAKLEKASEVTLFLPERWKYDLYAKVKGIDSRNIGDVIKAVMQTDLKSHGQEITRILPRIVGKIPEILLDSATEKKVLENSVSVIESEFGCKVRILDSEDSKEQKAKQALPGKPAIIVE